MSIALLELAAEVGLDGCVFGEDDHARGTAIEAVDEKAVVFEGWFGCEHAFRRTEEAGGLVDDENIGVFVDDTVFDARGSLALGNREEDFWGFGIDNFGVRLRDDFAIDGNIAGFDEVFKSAAVKFGMFFHQNQVEAFSLDFFGGFLQLDIAVDDARKRGLAEFLPCYNHDIIIT